MLGCISDNLSTPNQPAVPQIKGIVQMVVYQAQSTDSLSSPPSTHDLELISISKQFGSLFVLDDINLSAKAGEFVAIMGPSGCGKTTLLRVIAGLEGVSSGEVRLQGNNVVNLPMHQRNTPMVWQSFALFPHLNVHQNIAFGLTLNRHRKSEVQRKIQNVAAMMHLETMLDRRISQLSGGQKQRVAIARALVTEPPILLLDEPMSALDPHLRVRMQGELKRLQQALGITFIYVTHNQNEAFSMADKVVVMNRGRIEQIGSPSEIYNAPATHFVAEFVGNNNLFDGEIVRVRSETVTVQCSQGLMETKCREQMYREGDRVTVVVPADQIKISAHDSAVENCIRATLRAREFIGSQVIYFLETGTGNEIKVIRQESLNTSLGIPIDTELQLSWDTENTVVLGERIAT